MDIYIDTRHENMVLLHPVYTYQTARSGGPCSTTGGLPRRLRVSAPAWVSRWAVMWLGPAWTCSISGPLLHKHLPGKRRARALLLEYVQLAPINLPGQGKAHSRPTRHTPMFDTMESQALSCYVETLIHLLPKCYEEETLPLNYDVLLPREGAKMLCPDARALLNLNIIYPATCFCPISRNGWGRDILFF
jgi:hypothetical protein